MRGLLFLFSALLMLEPTKGGNYKNLNDHDRKIVDQAIEQGNKDHGQGIHLDFYIVQRIKNALNVILRPTSCDKTTPSVHRKDCGIRNKPPQVSCIHCNGTMMKPCLLLKKKDEIKERINGCPSSVKSQDRHFTGAGHLMFQKGGDKKQPTGCIGCI